MVFFNIQQKETELLIMKYCAWEFSRTKTKARVTFSWWFLELSRKYYLDSMTISKCLEIMCNIQSGANLTQQNIILTANWHAWLIVSNGTMYFFSTIKSFRRMTSIDTISLKPPYAAGTRYPPNPWLDWGISAKCKSTLAIIINAWWQSLTLCIDKMFAFWELKHYLKTAFLH